MRRFYFDPIFIGLFLSPIPFWMILNNHPFNFNEDLLLTLLTVSALYPVVEEIIFRGTIQQWLGRKFCGSLLRLSTANILTSLLFTLSHLINHSPYWALSTFIPSLIFGFVMERYKIIAAPIILHSTYNLGYFLSFGIN